MSIQKKLAHLRAAEKAPTTLPETNIESENEWLEDEFPFGKAHFQGRKIC